MLVRRVHSVARLCANAKSTLSATVSGGCVGARPPSPSPWCFCLAARGMMSRAAVPYLRVADYDCVGFDLDNTLVKYNIANMVKLEYDLLAHFLVDQKGYDAHYLLRPLDVDFLQKGLTMDYEKGNLLQLSADGSIHRAAHGTRLLSDAEIEDVYGKDRISTLTLEYTQSILDAWNGPMSERIRSVMDHFDIPVCLIFARCVDNVDAVAEKEDTPKQYNLYRDILDGLIYMFQRDNFGNNTGGFFPALKKNPELFIHRASDNLNKWMKELKSQKKVFLVTGSHVDFASFTAQYIFGNEWRSLFDVIVTFARKPGFFTGRRPFVALEGAKEMDVVEPEDIKLGNIYSQGNWQDLYELFKRETGQKHPKCLYVGDNVIQDVFAPDEYTRCQTVAISEEMRSEGVGNDATYLNVLGSNTWGSYFSQREGKVSLWCDIIKRHSLVCVPSMEVLAEKSIDSKIEPLGFYPKSPL